MESVRRRKGRGKRQVAELDTDLVSWSPYTVTSVLERTLAHARPGSRSMELQAPGSRDSRGEQSKPPISRANFYNKNTLLPVGFDTGMICLSKSCRYKCTSREQHAGLLNQRFTSSMMPLSNVYSILVSQTS